MHEGGNKNVKGGNEGLRREFKRRKKVQIVPREKIKG